MNKQQLISALTKIYNWTPEKAQRITELNILAGNIELSE